MKSINLLRYIVIIIYLVIYLLYNVNTLINIKYKFELTNYIIDYVIPYIVLDKTINNNKIFDNLKYPVVIKPSEIDGSSFYVKVAENKTQALKYYKELNDKYIIIQIYSKLPYEGTIVYQKNPITQHIKVEFVKRDLIKNTKYPIYQYHGINLNNKIYTSKKLYDKVSIISEKIPEFYFGRYDIKYNNLHELLDGKFEIIEVNTVSSLDTRYVPQFNFSIIYTFYSFVLRLYYGYLNILRGHSIGLLNFTKILINNINYCIKSKILNKIGLYIKNTI